jgi:hypothetical protein
MSPEQAEVNKQDVDTRSDVYSLGVLLYELMAGSTPLTRKRVKDAALLEVLRVIREEEPPRPSTRLLSTPELPSIAACRGLEPRKLNSLVRGELDWIVMKALEKDRNRRYETANALAADVQRYLADEAVQACPPSTTYRLRKFAGRNKSALALLTVIVAALVTTGTVATVGHFRTSAALTREAAANKQLESTLYYQTIDLAEQARAAGQVRLAEQLLRDCKPALRGWEWHYLNRLRYGRTPAVEHPSHLFTLAVSPGGRLVAVGGSDGTITVRDGQRLGVVWRRRAHDSWARSVAFSPDSQRLVSGGWDRRIRLWNMTDDLPMWEAKADDIVQCVAYHPDGHLIASSGASGHVQVWDARTGDLVSAIANHDDNLFALAFSPDGRELAGGGSDGRVKIWRTADGGLVRPHPARVGREAADVGPGGGADRTGGLRVRGSRNRVPPGRPAVGHGVPGGRLKDLGRAHEPARANDPGQGNLLRRLQPGRPVAGRRLIRSHSRLGGSRLGTPPRDSDRRHGQCGVLPPKQRPVGGGGRQDRWHLGHRDRNCEGGAGQAYEFLAECRVQPGWTDNRLRRVRGRN